MAAGFQGFLCGLVLGSEMCRLLPQDPHHVLFYFCSPQLPRALSSMADLEFYIYTISSTVRSNLLASLYLTEQTVAYSNETVSPNYQYECHIEHFIVAV